MAIPWILISIGILIILLAIVFVFRVVKTKKPWKPNYFAFFIAGISWIPLGLVFDMPIFWILGIIFMAAGLSHKKEWDTKSLLSINPRTNKKLWFAIVIGLILLFIFGLIFFTMQEKVSIDDSIEIVDFESCISAGYPAMESYPRQCRDPKQDTTFTEIIEFPVS